MLIRRKLQSLVFGTSTTLLLLAAGSWWSLRSLDQAFGEVTQVAVPRQLAALEDNQAGTELLASVVQVLATSDPAVLADYSTRATTLAKLLDPGDHSLTGAVQRALEADLARRTADQAVAASSNQMKLSGKGLKSGVVKAFEAFKLSKEQTSAKSSASLVRSQILTEQVAELARISVRIARLRLICAQAGMVTSRFKLAVPFSNAGDLVDDLSRRNLGLPALDQALSALMTDMRSQLLGETGAFAQRKAALALPEADRTEPLANAQGSMGKCLSALEAFEVTLATTADDLALTNRQAVTAREADRLDLLAADRATELCHELTDRVGDLLLVVHELEQVTDLANAQTIAKQVQTCAGSVRDLIPRLLAAAKEIHLDKEPGLLGLPGEFARIEPLLNGPVSLETSLRARIEATTTATAAKAQQRTILDARSSTAKSAALAAAKAQADAVKVVERTTVTANAISLTLAGGATLLALGIGWLLTRQITRGLTAACTALERDDGKRLTITGNDEIARLAKALNATIDRIAGNRDQVLAKALALAQAAERMGKIADLLRNNVATADQEAGAVAGSAETAAAAVTSVAAAAEELSASVREVAGSASNSSAASQEALSTAQDTSLALGRLAKTAQQIAEAAKTIDDIAKQTRLLSLNATIEATRAGEAGKGFAVVAIEVKELSRRAGEAAQGIGNLLTSIDTEANSSVQAMGRAVAAAERINEFAGSIAAAVEQQAATTLEISRVATDASQATAAAAGGVQRVATATSQVATSGQDIRATAAELSRLAEDLKGLTRPS